MLSIAVPPQATRPIERGERSGGAGSGDGNFRDTGLLDDTDARVDARSLKLAARPQADPPDDHRGRNLNMVFDEKSGRTIIEVIHPRTGEVLSRIPPENLLELAEREKLPARANLVDETA